MLRRLGGCSAREWAATDSVSDDFNVELVEILGGETVTEVRSCNGGQSRCVHYDLTRMLTERSLDNDGRIEFFDVGSDAEGGHSVEHSEWVTSLEQVVGISFVQRSSDKQDDLGSTLSVSSGRSWLSERKRGYIVDHVGIPVQ